MKKLKVLLCIVLALIILNCGILAFLHFHSDDASSWKEQFDLGVRYLNEGNYEEAILAFSAAIEIDPRNVDAYARRAEAYLAVGNEEAAWKDYETIREINPEWVAPPVDLLETEEAPRATEASLKETEETEETVADLALYVPDNRKRLVFASRKGDIDEEWSFSYNESKQLVKAQWSQAYSDGGGEHYESGEESYSYDSHGNLIRVDWSRDSDRQGKNASYREIQYDCNENGEIVAIRNNPDYSDFQYNEQGRLVGWWYKWVTGENWQNLQYSFDEETKTSVVQVERLRDSQLIEITEYFDFTYVPIVFTRSEDSRTDSDGIFIEFMPFDFGPNMLFAFDLTDLTPIFGWTNSQFREDYELVTDGDGNLVEIRDKRDGIAEWTFQYE